MNALLELIYRILRAALSDRYPMVKELTQGQKTSKQSHWAPCSLLLTTTPSSSGSQPRWDNALSTRLGLHAPWDLAHPSAVASFFLLLLMKCLLLPKHLCSFALAYPCLLGCISVPPLVVPPASSREESPLALQGLAPVSPPLCWMPLSWLTHQCVPLSLPSPHF